MPHNAFDWIKASIWFQKKKSEFVLLILAVFIFSSCTSLSKLGVKDYPIDSLNKGNYFELDGFFMNNHDTIIGEIVHKPENGVDNLKSQTLLNQLFLNIPESYYRDNDGNIIDPKEKWIELKFLSNKKATVTMYHNDKVVFSKVIHGKIKNGYFYLRPKIYVIPFVPLVFGYNFERTRIGKSGNILLVDHSVNMWGFALVAGSSERAYTSSSYLKKK